MLSAPASTQAPRGIQGPFEARNAGTKSVHDSARLWCPPRREGGHAESGRWKWGYFRPPTLKSAESRAELRALRGGPNRVATAAANALEAPRSTETHGNERLFAWVPTVIFDL